MTLRGKMASRFLLSAARIVLTDAEFTRGYSPDFRETFITRENLLKINLKFRSISFIHDILRRPRSFSNVEKWKASEVRLFILYIGLPVLAEFLLEERIEDFALYNVILRLLHDYWDNDKKLGDSIS
ncbi:unnamed protein product, partial [Rotaria sordida]